jgi:hypothetical protein
MKKESPKKYIFLPVIIAVIYFPISLGVVVFLSRNFDIDKTHWLYEEILFFFTFTTSVFLYRFSKKKLNKKYDDNKSNEGIKNFERESLKDEDIETDDDLRKIDDLLIEKNKKFDNKYYSTFPKLSGNNKNLHSNIKTNSATLNQRHINQNSKVIIFFIVIALLLVIALPFLYEKKHSRNTVKSIESKQSNGFIEPLQTKKNNPTVSEENKYDNITSIVIGSFGAKLNAEKQKRKLISEGFSNIKISKFESLYRVSVLVSGSKKKVQEVYKRVRAYHKSAWISYKQTKDKKTERVDAYLEYAEKAKLNSIFKNATEYNNTIAGIQTKVIVEILSINDYSEVNDMRIQLLEIQKVINSGVDILNRIYFEGDTEQELKITALKLFMFYDKVFNNDYVTILDLMEVISNEDDEEIKISSYLKMNSIIEDFSAKERVIDLEFNEAQKSFARKNNIYQIEANPLQEDLDELNLN